MQTRIPSARPQFILLLLFVILFVFFTYTFLHEMGHAMAGLFFGQTLTEFDVSFWDFSAHVGMAGGQLTQGQLAIQSAAGAALPLVAWTIFISLVPRKANFALEVLKLLSSLNVVNTLLVWIVLPILFLTGTAPSDDVTYFLRYSQVPPLLLALTALLLYLASWILYLSKIDGLQNEFLLFRTTDQKILIAGTRLTIPVMTGIMAFGAIIAFLLNLSAAKNPLGRFSPPQDFAPVAQIDLSAREYSSQVLADFSLEETAYAGIFIIVQDINTSYFDLSVIGRDGYHSTVLHGEGYRTDQDGGLWEENLPPGKYQLLLTSHQSPGTASVYLKTP